MVNPRDITLAILAGGEGARMGTPKGRLKVRGRPILEYLLDRFAWAGPTMLVTAPEREHPPGWRRFDVEVSDPASGLGPLRGVLTALEHLTTPALVIATVDMPLVEPPHLLWLAEQLLGIPDGSGVFPSHFTGETCRTEPFPCALFGRAACAVREKLLSDRRSVVALQHCDGFTAIPVPCDWPSSVWTNLNHPAEFTAFEASIASDQSRSDVP